VKLVELLKISGLIKIAVFVQDPLQDELVKRHYMIKDENFRKAYFKDYTSSFLESVEFAIMRREPVSIAMMGRTRSGKSTSAFTILKKILDFNLKRIIFEINKLKFKDVKSDELFKLEESVKGVNLKELSKIKDEAEFEKAKNKMIMQETEKKKLTTYNICANEFEYVRKLKECGTDTAFLIDESKRAVYGIGSIAKREKINDIQNIIAVNNISAIWLKPDEWATPHAHYGLVSFGRAENDIYGNPLPIRINRFMLYNLQESDKRGLPLGMVYIPLIWDILPKEEALTLENEYMSRKLKWVEQEQISEEDVFTSDRFKLASELAKDQTFINIKGLKNKLPYVRTQYSSNMTNGELDEVMRIAIQIQRGVISEDKVKEIMDKTL